MLDGIFSRHDPRSMQLSGKERISRKPVRHLNLKLLIAVSEVKDIVFSKAERETA